MMDTLLKAQYNQTKRLAELNLISNITEAQKSGKSFTEFIDEYTPENVKSSTEALLESKQEIANYWKLPEV